MWRRKRRRGLTANEDVKERDTFRDGDGEAEVGLLDFLFPCFLQRLPLLAPPITDDLLKVFADVTIVRLYSQYLSVKAEKLFFFLLYLPATKENN